GAGAWIETATTRTTTRGCFRRRAGGVKARLLVAVDLDTHGIEPVDTQERGQGAFPGRPIQTPDRQDIEAPAPGAAGHVQVLTRGGVPLLFGPTLKHKELILRVLLPRC